MLNSIAGIYMSLITAMPSAQTLLFSSPSVTEAAVAPEDHHAPTVHVVTQASGLNGHAFCKPVSPDDLQSRRVAFGTETHGKNIKCTMIYSTCNW